MPSKLCFLRPQPQAPLELAIAGLASPDPSVRTLGSPAPTTFIPAIEGCLPTVMKPMADRFWGPRKKKYLGDDCGRGRPALPEVLGLRQPSAVSLLVAAGLNGTIEAAKHQTNKQVPLGCLFSI